MKLSEALALSVSTLLAARDKHPVWPTDLIHGAAIVAEEAGELAQAALDHVYHGRPRVRCREEALHVIATALRFLTEE